MPSLLRREARPVHSGDSDILGGFGTEVRSNVQKVAVMQNMSYSRTPAFLISAVTWATILVVVCTPEVFINHRRHLIQLITPFRSADSSDQHNWAEEERKG